MADLIIIYDEAREIAAFVNPDTQQGWGPAMIGPGADQALQAWAEAMPFDVSVLTSDQASELFAGFLEGVREGLTQEATTPPESPLDASGPSDLDQAAQAQQEAAETAGAPPEPAPADTDEDAGTPRPVTIIGCPACEGRGVIDLGGDTGEVRCNMCQGTKVITVAA